MLKIGITGYPASGHARRVASIVNGLSREPVEAERQSLSRKDPEVAELMHIEKLWPPQGVNSPQMDDVRQVAQDFGIPEICESREEFAKDLDGVLILTDWNTNHQKYAPFFLRAGIPVYVDKPFSLSPLEAEAIIQVARETGTPFMTAAASRFASQVAQLKAELAELGKVLTATATAPAWAGMTFYGVHGLEMLFEVVGWDVVKVFNVGDIDRNIVRLTYRDGLNCMLLSMVPMRLRSLLVMGTQNWRWIEVHDFQDFFSNMLKTIGRLFKTGEARISLEEQLRVTQVLTAAERSAILQRPIEVVP